ncbi:MAG: hypothetical protein HY043_22760 [Verrucomicrobia bacterium]|nr:hypothetical protein [Verrucomicrobiota bacterium]
MSIGISRVYFAIKLGVDSSYLSNLEHARAPVRCDLVRALGVTFNLCQRWLAEGKDPQLLYVPVDDYEYLQIPKRAVFSKIYDSLLKPHIEFEIAAILKARSEENSRTSAMMKRAQNQPTVIEFGTKLESPGGWKVVTNDEMTSTFLTRIRDFAWKIASEIPSAELERYADAFEAAAQEIGASGKLTQAPTIEMAESEKSKPGAAVRRKTLSVVNNQLTIKSSIDNESSDMNKTTSLIDTLRERLRRVTTARGAKAALAKEFGVSRQAVSGWLSGVNKPEGETALHLLAWVTAEEAKQQKSSVSATTPAEPKTQIKKAQHANLKSGRKKK